MMKRDACICEMQGHQRGVYGGVKAGKDVWGG